MVTYGRFFASAKPDLAITVTDGNKNLYDDYHVTVKAYNKQEFDNLFWSDADTWKDWFLSSVEMNEKEYTIYDEFDVLKQEKPTIHLPGGYYIVTITDNKTNEILNVWNLSVTEDGLLDSITARTEQFAGSAKSDKETEQPAAGYYSVNLQDVPDGLVSFLSGFGEVVTRDGAKGPYIDRLEYDCLNGRRARIIGVLPYIANWFEGYPVSFLQDPSTVDVVATEQDVNWLLTNIYNFSPKTLEKAKEIMTHGKRYSDGKYYWGVGAGMPGYMPKNMEITYNGKYYCVAYDSYHIYVGLKDFEPDQPVSKHYALLEYKMIDGKGYWSIYKDTIHSDEMEKFKKRIANGLDYSDNEEIHDVTDLNYLAEEYYSIYLSYLESLNCGNMTILNTDLDLEQELCWDYWKDIHHMDDRFIFINQVFDFDITASKITIKENNAHEADCYVVVQNRKEQIKTGEVAQENHTIHAKLKYDPYYAEWIMTSQEEEPYSYEGHTMIHCGE